VANFICASDESSDQNPRSRFFYGGFAASVADWEDIFAPAWAERVLDGPPTIPYLHMTDIRSSEWRERYGLSESAAERRVDEASRVVCSTGALIPVVCHLTLDEFEKHLRMDVQLGDGRVDVLAPDYMAWSFFAIAQLDLISERDKQAERVDFWVEENGKIGRNLVEFKESLKRSLAGLPELAHLTHLIGELKPVGKSIMSVQAADMLCWHARRNASGNLGREGRKRYSRMTTGGAPERRGRYGLWAGLDERFLESIRSGEWPLKRH
jgi:hypothetical protein